MQFIDSSPSSWANSKLQQSASLQPQMTGNRANRKLDCGWYDSSFDLAQGLDVIEQGCDTIYQLWELSQN